MEYMIKREGERYYDERVLKLMALKYARDECCLTRDDVAAIRGEKSRRTLLHVIAEQNFMSKGKDIFSFISRKHLKHIINEKNAQYILSLYEEFRVRVRLHQMEECDVNILENMRSLFRIQDIFGFTPLHIAVMFSRGGNCVSLLTLDPGLVNIKDFQGFTPLMHAIGVNMNVCKKSNEEVEILCKLNMVLTLVSFSADVNIKDSMGRTCLHLAAMHNYVSIVRVLLCMGAKNVKDNRGRLPESCAPKSSESKRVLREFKWPKEDEKSIDELLSFIGDDEETSKKKKKKKKKKKRRSKSKDVVSTSSENTTTKTDEMTTRDLHDVAIHGLCDCSLPWNRCLVCNSLTHNASGHENKFVTHPPVRTLMMEDNNNKNEFSETTEKNDFSEKAKEEDKEMDFSEKSKAEEEEKKEEEEDEKKKKIETPWKLHKPSSEFRRMQGKGAALKSRRCDCGLSWNRCKVCTCRDPISNGQVGSRFSPVVIDASNVCRHGDGKWVTSRLCKVIEYFEKEKKCPYIAAIAPRSVVHNKRKESLADNRKLLNEFQRQKKLFFTPSQDYDDSYILSFAMKRGSCIVSNDSFRDAWSKNSNAREFLKSHRISFAFVYDEFVPNPDFQYPKIQGT
jgi:ankyrin repeat protein